MNENKWLWSYNLAVVLGCSSIVVWVWASHHLGTLGEGAVVILLLGLNAAGIYNFWKRM